jgi:hypothetical protein
MNSDTALLIVGVSAVVSAVAIVVQAVILFGFIRAAKALFKRLDELIPKAEIALAKAELTMEHGRKGIDEISARSLEVISLTRAQLARVDDLMADATARLRVQMDRAEIVMDDTLNRTQETVATFHNGIMRPLRQFTGVAAGIRGALDYFLKGGRPNVSQATQDEEMFI